MAGLTPSVEKLARGLLTVTSPRLCGERSPALRGRVRGTTFTSLGPADNTREAQTPHPRRSAATSPRRAGER